VTFTGLRVLQHEGQAVCDAVDEVVVQLAVGEVDLQRTLQIDTASHHVRVAEETDRFQTLQLVVEVERERLDLGLHQSADRRTVHQHTHHTGNRVQTVAGDGVRSRAGHECGTAVRAGGTHEVDRTIHDAAGFDTQTKLRHLHAAEHEVLVRLRVVLLDGVARAGDAVGQLGRRNADQFRYCVDGERSAGHGNRCSRSRLYLKDALIGRRQRSARNDDAEPLTYCQTSQRILASGS